ncbi:tripartite tricarboxylate transporter permease [Iocasia frigidifontis]|uniref:Tripartite tricarboxylate transporter permease n=1 Tax=Iocasia fonsfrigidae TaxID=2682810 RepID=A0A8A7KI16_9FIRM|nr:MULTISPECIES: tripartite tricarboxylate transporter permease [Halanaerobiaceae]AZO94862.1 tripartite tricarboxylate transporter permease [Halocella sp. SP3-1]MTI58548.1 tripartite tricarboxylate transporter permease [Bacillota bacterium]QTL97774.1 tripartite tricarboxylate transporter permease [Iocasia fonsfrigidae]
MDVILNNLIVGFQTALTPGHLFWITIGGILGTIIGMLPGLGPATGVAVLLPMTFSMGPVTSLITMCGIYYGAMFGGSRSSILINTPGDGAALAATFDGYPMSQQGRAEAALAMSAIASFIGGIIATVFMTLVANPVANFALRFGPAEYFLLMVTALSATASMSKKNLVRGFISMILGLMISTVGLDSQSGINRFTFGVLELQTGIDFLVVIIAIYALGEVFKCFKEIHEGKKKAQTKFGKIWITKEDWKKSWLPILRSTPLGFFVGALPGAGGTMASLMAYNNEKQLAKNPDDFGKGEIVGLAAPEAANNAASVGALIPMLTLGIPGSGTTAVMMGALLMLGLQPGPLLFTQHPDIAWGLIASMFLGNMLLAIINIPLAGLLVRVLSIPPKILYPIVLGLAFIGTFAISNSVIDFYLLVIFGLMGYFMKNAGIPTAPLILGVIVGNKMEISFRQALIISDGSYRIFVASPVAIVLIILTVISVAYPFLKDYFKNTKEITA